MGIEDESAMVGGVLSAGINTVMTDFVKIATKDPEMLDELKGVEIDKDGVNEMINVTI